MSSINPRQIAVILVEPTQPGNIGSTARAMDNMGITDFRLVNPCHYFHPEARMFSMNARYLLHQAKTFGTLEEALADRQLIIGTTAREREKIKKLTSLHNLENIVSSYPEDIKIALVFGTEQSGLRNEHLDLCNEWVYIPTFGKSSSLNLSQAVVVTLYELSKFFGISPAQTEFEIIPASSSSIEGMKSHLFSILEKTGFLHKSSKETVWTSFSDMIGRAKPDERDVRMIRGFFNRIEVTIRRLKKKLP
ncbi:MAG: RNA methyltransferase [Proteobacteria bacterium]|nr:RNA methyltransferase [Pseudomonadota bacterium]